MSEAAVKDCPECGKDVRRVINGGAGIIFKGSGFYVNDSKGKSPATTSAQKSNSQTGEASGGDAGAAAAGPADKKSGAESGTKPAGDSGSPAASSPAATETRTGSKAGAKESA
jgi:predicted nucleic acid-binding Zn ribbon protein